LVFGEREQQVFHRHELMTLLTGLFVALADGDFEILAEHPDLLRCVAGRQCRDGYKMGVAAICSISPNNPVLTGAKAFP
jgi:hypothetical protein